MLLSKDTSRLFGLGTTIGGKELLKFGRDLQNDLVNDGWMPRVTW